MVMSPYSMNNLFILPMLLNKISPNNSMPP